MASNYSPPVFDTSWDAYSRFEIDGSPRDKPKKYAVHELPDGWEDIDIYKGLGVPPEATMMVSERGSSTWHFGTDANRLLQMIVDDQIATGTWTPPRLSGAPSWVSNTTDAFPPVESDSISLEDVPGYYREGNYGKGKLKKALGSTLAKQLVKRAAADVFDLGSGKFSSKIETFGKSEHMTDIWAPDETAKATIARKLRLPEGKVTDKKLAQLRSGLGKATDESLEARKLPETFYVFRGGELKGSSSTPTAVTLSPTIAAEFGRTHGPYVRMYEVNRDDVLLDVDAVVWGSSSRDPFTGAVDHGEWQHKEQELIVRVGDLRNPREITLPYTQRYFGDKVRDEIRERPMEDRMPLGGVDDTDDWEAEAAERNLQLKKYMTPTQLKFWDEYNKMEESLTFYYLPQAKRDAMNKKRTKILESATRKAVKEEIAKDPGRKDMRKRAKENKESADLEAAGFLAVEYLPADRETIENLVESTPELARKRSKSAQVLGAIRLLLLEEQGVTEHPRAQKNVWNSALRTARSITGENPGRYTMFTEPVYDDDAMPSGGTDDAVSQPTVVTIHPYDKDLPKELEGLPSFAKKCYVCAHHAGQKNNKANPDSRVAIVQGRIKQLQGGHGWVEIDDQVYDPVIDLVTTKEKYYGITDAIPTLKLSPHEAALLKIKTNHPGPYSSEEVADSLGNRRPDYPERGVPMAEMKKAWGGYKETLLAEEYSKEERSDAMPSGGVDDTSADWRWTCPPISNNPDIETAMSAAECRAVDNLARNKYSQAGYHASAWVNYNKVLNELGESGLDYKRISRTPFAPLVAAARDIKLDQKDRKFPTDLERVVDKGHKDYSEHAYLVSKPPENPTLEYDSDAMPGGGVDQVTTKTKKKRPTNRYTKSGKLIWRSGDQYTDSTKRYAYTHPDGSTETVEIEEVKILQPRSKKFMRGEYGPRVVDKKTPLINRKTGKAETKPITKYWTLSQAFTGGRRGKGDPLGGFMTGAFQTIYKRSDLNKIVKNLEAEGMQGSEYKEKVVDGIPGYGSWVPLGPAQRSSSAQDLGKARKYLQKELSDAMPSGGVDDAAGQEKSDVALTILKQLGGNMFGAFTGAKNYVSLSNEPYGGLKFRLPKTHNGINSVLIKLNGRDLYDVEFWKIGRMPSSKQWAAGKTQKVEKVRTYNDVYGDGLTELFRGETGLATNFMPSGGVDDFKNPEDRSDHKSRYGPQETEAMPSGGTDDASQPGDFYEEKIRGLRWSDGIVDRDTGNMYFEIDGNLWAAPMQTDGSPDMQAITEVEVGSQAERAKVLELVRKNTESKYLRELGDKGTDAMPADAPALFEPRGKFLPSNFPTRTSSTQSKPKQPSMFSSLSSKRPGKVQNYQDTVTGTKYRRRSAGTKPRGKRFVSAK